MKRAFSGFSMKSLRLSFFQDMRESLEHELLEIRNRNKFEKAKFL